MRRLLGAVCAVVLTGALVAFVPAPAQALAPRIDLVSHTAWPSVIDPTAGGSLSVRATNLGERTGTLRLDSRPGQTVRDGEVVTFDLATLPEGNHQLSLMQCNELQACRTVYRELVVRISPRIFVWETDTFLNENGDGLWESATARIALDPDVDVAAQWSVNSGNRLVAGPFALTPEQISVARTATYGVAIPIHAQTVGKRLASGDYTIEVQATGIEPDFTKTAINRSDLHVSTAPVLTSLTPRAPVFYPHDPQPGVAQEVVLSPRLDAQVVKYGASMFEVIDMQGRSLNAWFIEDDGVIRWDGRYYPDTGRGGWQVAPAGRYRIRVLAVDDGVQQTALVSAPFRLSHAYRERVEVIGRKRSAASTRTATLTTRAARVRAVGGSLVYRTHRGAAPPSGALVRTVHKIRVPSSPIKNDGPILRVRGRWEHESDISVIVVTPSGRRVQYLALLDRRRRWVYIEPRWIRRDGTVKFHLRWRGGGSGRVDSIAVSRMTYRWRQ